MPRVEAAPRLFDVGQKVMARWPKTSLYFKGEVLDFNDIEYLIRFDDEEKSELAIKYKDVSVSLFLIYKNYITFQQEN